jgi:DNA-binding GntR family transcriptional regulator
MAYLLTDEHQLMIQAIIDRDIEKADELARAHTRQFRDNFFEFMRQNLAKDMPL